MRRGSVASVLTTEVDAHGVPPSVLGLTTVPTNLTSVDTSADVLVTHATAEDAALVGTNAFGLLGTSTANTYCCTSN